MSLHERSEVIPIRTQRVPQSIETPVSFVSVPGAYVRFAYSRSGDSMASHIEGQDYLCFQHNDQRFVGVVCDGVGSSFCGNLAARMLGDGLLEWLWSVDITYLGGASALAEAATSSLNRLQKIAKHEVDEYQIPDQISPLVRQALEAQRTYGSESVFVAVRVDHPSVTVPDGLISLCWMGDSQMHIYGVNGEEIPIGGSWDNTNRWSTTQGVRGQMSTWMQDLTHIGRIMAFTDGLSAHAAKVAEYSDDHLDRQIRAGSRMPTSDDVSFLDVVLRTPQYEGYPDPDVPDVGMARPTLDQIWNPTGTSTYELHWKWTGQANSSFMVQEATNPALTDGQVMNVIAKDLTWKPETAQAPGHYYYRVRAASKRGAITPWSELRQTKVAYPPPSAPSLSLLEADTTPTLSWEVEGDSLDFTLEASPNLSFEEPETVYSGRNTSWTLPAGSMKPGTLYFRVQAMSDGGPSPWSDAQEVTITMPPPPRPHLGSASFPYVEGIRSYELRWQPVPGATRYELEEHEQDADTTDVIATTDALYRREDPPEGHYVYRVRACHDYGCSDWSNEQTVIISALPPDDAPEVALEGPDADAAIRLTWADIERAIAYEIEVSQDETFRSAKVMISKEPNFALVRREPGAMAFRVRGTNTGGAGPWSTPSSIAITPRTPDWIEISAQADGRLSISWANVGNRLEYILEFSVSGDPAAFVEVYHGEDTRFEFKPSVAGMGGSARVRAESNGVVSAWQATSLAVPSGALAAPQLEASLDASEGVRLTWNATMGAGSYVIETSRDEAFTMPHRQETDKLTGLFHPPTSGRYWFRIRAARGGELGPASNIVLITTQQPTAPAVWPIDPVKENALFDVAWTGVPGCTYYELQGSAEANFDPASASSVRVNHPSQKFTVPGRPKGTYYYRVRAVDESGQASPWSQTLSVDVT